MCYFCLFSFPIYMYCFCVMLVCNLTYFCVSSWNRKPKNPVKQHDAQISTGYVQYGCIFSKLQPSAFNSSIAAKTKPSSSIIRKRSLSCIGRRDTFIRLVHGRRARESTLIVLSQVKTPNLHDLFVNQYMLPVLEDYSLGTDGEWMLPSLMKNYKCFCYLCSFSFRVFFRTYSVVLFSFVKVLFPRVCLLFLRVFLFKIFNEATNACTSGWFYLFLVFVCYSFFM